MLTLRKATGKLVAFCHICGRVLHRSHFSCALNKTLVTLNMQKPRNTAENWRLFGAFAAVYLTQWVRFCRHYGKVDNVSSNKSNREWRTPISCILQLVVVKHRYHQLNWCCRWFHCIFSTHQHRKLTESHEFKLVSGQKRRNLCSVFRTSPSEEPREMAVLVGGKNQITHKLKL